MEVLTTMIKTIKKAVIATAAVLTFVLPQSAFAKDNVLNVGCEGAFAPFTFIGDDGKITGFDIELIKVLAKDMGYDEAKITVMPFDGLIPS